MAKCKCPRCDRRFAAALRDRKSNVLDASEMSDTGLGNRFCINCGIYFYDTGQARGSKESEQAR
ncbi:hypothetical protein G7B40_040315 [Aetokthonos hydrillicola Thurmond2011]|jgi:hypothetical protein|uniref:Uncharacterized protein n=1 Tax=Aetokthonos hydrillicola Thurmond2011 TaxID=2712845 RepID=A0AAP5IIN2_9CYAN|nr:hypothetical protein [Aetokthonos hydrillicola]MBO3459974.1 hypothetical protein [Aetokthonos hydrillicola CCALA 1050]MBW4584093.1 hypothetical protein [Aetokthonos hydrillicola CCALA 1050]MDR9900735.1 hypothetical protein [Aetokthonos hydrillicola Thurmond2011]